MRSVYDLTDTNTIPNAAEISAISSALAEPKQRIHTLDGQITVLETTLNRLLQEEERLSKDIDAHIALLSPFRHLPPDILREIFYHCLPLDRNPVMCNAEAPMVLVQVCSQWREVALTTPKLWVAIHIAIPADPTTYLYQKVVCNNSIRIKAVVEWLSRSGILPLSLSATLANTTLVGVHSVAEQYVDALLTFASRWRNISLTLYGYDKWGKFLDKIQATDVPLLESIYLAGLDGGTSDGGTCCTISKSSSGLFKAPRLHAITIPQRCSCFLQLSVKWSQLTHLDLRDQHWSLYNLMSALAQCPGLQHVRIRLPSRPSIITSDSTFRRISLTRLISLSVLDSYRLNSFSLFQNLHTPNLRHLSYQRQSHRYSYTGRMKFNQVFIAFCSQVADTLEELKVHTASIICGDIMGYLYLLPGLKRLSLIGPYKGPLEDCFCDMNPRFDEYFIFGNKELLRFTKSVVRVDKNEILGSGGDTSFECYDDEPIRLVLASSENTELEFDSQSPKTPLCPKLEVFHCHNVVFTPSALYDFLQARSSPDPNSGVVPLRRAIVRFSQVKDCKKVYKALKELKEQTGMVIEVSKQVEFQPFSPIQTPLAYEGLPAGDNSIPGIAFTHEHQSYFGF